MEDGNIYVYDFSELREEVKVIETQISELLSVQSEQASEMVSIMSEAAQYNVEIKSYSQLETILLFAIIGFIGVLCGVVGALTWRSNIHG